MASIPMRSRSRTCRTPRWQSPRAPPPPRARHSFWRWAILSGGHRLAGVTGRGRGRLNAGGDRPPQVDDPLLLELRLHAQEVQELLEREQLHRVEVDLDDLVEPLLDLADHPGGLRLRLAGKGQVE